MRKPESDPGEVNKMELEIFNFDVNLQDWQEELTEKITPKNNSLIMINNENPNLPVLNKKISLEGPLKSKYIKHFGGKPFKCSFNNCGKSYANRCRLQVHDRTHTGERPFKCLKCKKTFNEKGNLKTHYRIHTGDKPFECNFPNCSAKFKARGHLMDHEKSHANLKAYTCDKCGKGFSRSGTLKCHVKTHLNQKPFKCNFEKCFKSFKKVNYLQSHIKKIHSDPNLRKVEGLSEKITTDLTQKKNSTNSNFLSKSSEGLYSPVPLPNNFVIKVRDDFQLNCIAHKVVEVILNGTGNDLCNFKRNNETLNDYTV